MLRALATYLKQGASAGGGQFPEAGGGRGSHSSSRGARGAGGRSRSRRRGVTASGDRIASSTGRAALGAGAAGGTVAAPAAAPCPGAGSLSNAVQQSDKQDIGGQLVHAAAHQDAALRAAQLVAGADNALQAAAAEGVLAREHLGRRVQALQAHGALQQVQQRRLVHGPSSGGGWWSLAVAAASASCRSSSNSSPPPPPLFSSPLFRGGCLGGAQPGRP